MWEFLLDMHSGNRAANGYGQAEIANLTDKLLSDTGEGAPVEDLESNHEDPDDPEGPFPEC